MTYTIAYGKTPQGGKNMQTSGHKTYLRCIALVQLSHEVLEELCLCWVFLISWQTNWLKPFASMTSTATWAVFNCCQMVCVPVQRSMWKHWFGRFFVAMWRIFRTYSLVLILDKTCQCDDSIIERMCTALTLYIDVFQSCLAYTEKSIINSRYFMALCNFIQLTDFVPVLLTIICHLIDKWCTLVVLVQIIIIWLLIGKCLRLHTFQMRNYGVRYRELADWNTPSSPSNESTTKANAGVNKLRQHQNISIGISIIIIIMLMRARTLRSDAHYTITICIHTWTCSRRRGHGGPAVVEPAYYSGSRVCLASASAPETWLSLASGVRCTSEWFYLCSSWTFTCMDWTYIITKLNIMFLSDWKTGGFRTIRQHNGLHRLNFVYFQWS